MRARDTLLLAICFGLLTGLGEVLLIAHHRFLLGKTTLVSQHITWMAPLGVTAIFLAVGVVLLAASLLHAPAAQLPAGSFLFALLGTLSITFLLPSGIHPLAAGVLATGVGFQAYRVSKRDPGRLRRKLATATVTTLAAILALNATVLGSRSLSARRAYADPATSAEGPNVLLIILDTVRARSLSLYGRERATSPRLDSFAERGLVFERAIAPSPWTLPSHASIFTGRYPHRLSVDWEKPLDAEHETLAEALSRAGYATGGFAGNLFYASRVHGLSRGFEHYDDHPVSPGQIALSTALGRAAARSSLLRRVFGHEDLLNRKSAADITGAFLRWVDVQSDQPFFAFLNLFDAHEPYLPPAPFDTLFGPTGPRSLERQGGLRRDDRASRGRKWETTPEQASLDLAAYEASITSIDAELGRLFRELEARALLEGTLVIVTADHGEQQGEHGLYGHLNSLYEPLLRVPLVIVGPGVPRGRTDRVTSLTDIAATVLDLTGVEAQIPGIPIAGNWMDQNDSVPALSSLRTGLVLQEWYPVGRGQEMYSLWSGDHHYICNGDGSDELYDTRRDPEEERSLATVGDSEPVLSWFRAQLGRALERPPPCP